MANLKLIVTLWSAGGRGIRRTWTDWSSWSNIAVGDWYQTLKLYSGQEHECKWCIWGLLWHCDGLKAGHVEKRQIWKTQLGTDLIWSNIAVQNWEQTLKLYSSQEYHDLVLYCSSFENEAYFDLAGLMAGHLISSGHIRKYPIWDGLTEELITDIKTLWS